MSRQQSLGGSVSVGMGKMGGSASYSQSKVNSDYASVIEQSGVKAGDGGFQVNVRGNTDLKGGVIASSEQAAAENKNRVTTRTLTQSDIENRASYEAQSIGISGGYACEAVMSSGQAALSDLAHALYFAKTGDQKAYVKALIVEQTLDMDRQYPNLAALGERAGFLDQLALQLQQMWADVGPAGASSGLISSGNVAISHARDKYVPSVKPVANMDQFFNGSDFGEQVRANTDKRPIIYDGQSVYVATDHIGEHIRKGDLIHLDGRHKDHLEVFNKNGNFKSVLNLDGTYNQKKTTAASKQGRVLK